MVVVAAGPGLAGLVLAARVAARTLIEPHLEAFGTRFPVLGLEPSRPRACRRLRIRLRAPNACFSAPGCQPGAMT
ncbi:hypothetical protein DPR02_22820 [Burkholderia cepacia]|uniref:Uncharacterized protein n=1 Tax=Burkholderia cepacia TaxID=292 RepID=A0AAQ0FBF1_BURCE|nr:hypothetical protein DPR02_22820 [Burkholderia cepacia]